MKVTGHSAALAVSAIFERLGVNMGGRLLLTELAEEWKTSGMRFNDLELGVRQGVEWAAFGVEQTEDGPCISYLSKKPLLEGRDDNPLLAKVKAEDARAVQAKAAKRKPGSTPGTERRRKGPQ